MKQIIFFGFMFISVVSCNDVGTKSPKINDSITTNIQFDSIKKTSKEDSLYRNSDSLIKPNAGVREQILGTWALVGDEVGNASFKIEKDRVFYPDLFKYYKYKIENDSFKINFVDYQAAYLFKMKGNDTLIYVSEDGEQKYYRFKKK